MCSAVCLLLGSQSRRIDFLIALQVWRSQCDRLARIMINGVGIHLHSNGFSLDLSLINI